MDAAAEQVSGQVTAALAAAGVPHVIGRAGSMFSVFFTDAPVRCYADAQSQNVAAFKAFFHAMLERGVYLPPSAFEAWFLSAAHDDDAIARIGEALPAAAAAAAAAG